MSLVLATLPLTSAGTKQFGELPIVFTGYQVKDSLLDYFIYTNNSPAYPLTPVGTGASVNVLTTDFAPSGDLFTTLYNPSQTPTNFTLPLVGVKKDYVRISRNTAAGGAKLSVSWDLSLQNWFVVVAKANAANIAAKLIIRSSAGNEAVCSFTTPATANTWSRFIFNFKVNGSPNVTFNGNPNFSSITELEISLDAANTSVDVAMLYAVNNYSQIIGNKIVYKHTCVSEFGFENTLDFADLLCNQQVSQRTATSRKIEITIGAKRKDIEAQAIALGDIIKLKTGYFLQLLNDENVGRKEFSSSGTITLPNNLNIALVEIDGVGVLKEYHNSSSVPENAYHYAGTTLTVNSIYAGKIPRIYIWSRENKPTRTVNNLDLGFLGFMQIPRRMENGKFEYITAPKVQVSLDNEAFNEDFDQINFRYSVFPHNGKYVEIANDL